jgi:hypothetical protein
MLWRATANLGPTRRPARGLAGHDPAHPLPDCCQANSGFTSGSVLVHIGDLIFYNQHSRRVPFGAGDALSEVQSTSQLLGVQACGGVSGHLLGPGLSSGSQRCESKEKLGEGAAEDGGRAPDRARELGHVLQADDVQ